MKRSSHNRLTKSLLPWVDGKVIDKVNKALDSPDPVSKLVSVFTGAAAKKESLLAFGIDRIGHRSSNFRQGDRTR